MTCGKNFRVYLVGGFAAIGGFLSGYHTGVISGVLTMNNFTNMICSSNWISNCTAIYNKDSNYLIGSIVGVLLFGCFVGSLIGGQTGDRFSRKYSICAFSVIFTIGAALQTCAINLWMILAGRLFAGIAIGSLSMMVPLYHSEIAETKVRGRITTLQQFAITFGIAISFWINLLPPLSISDHTIDTWRISLGIQIIPSIILAIGILFCPFSPRWLISHDREEEARDVLMKIRSASYDEIKDEMNRIRNELADLRENEIESYRQLLQFPLLRPFLLGIGIHIFQQLNGINTILYYAPRLITKFNINITIGAVKGPLLITGIFGTVNFLFTIPTIFFIDKLGRRVLLIAGAIVMFISFLFVTIFAYLNTQASPWTIIVFLHIFVAGFAFSWGPIPFIYCAEIFPLTMRAKATSLTLGVNWGMNCMISFVAPLVITKNSWETFLTFSILCAFMVGIVYLFYPETKDKHLEERDIVESRQVFIPQWLEVRRRRSYGTSLNEKNSINQSNHNSSSNVTIRNDDEST